MRACCFVVAVGFQVIEKVSQRKGELQNFGEHAGKTRLTFLAPARGLIG